MESNNDLTEAIRSRGFRMTDQRREIIRILSGREHLTPSEIHQQLVAGGFQYTEPTVYRTLNFLCEQGLVLVTHAGGRQLLYELTYDKHHHLVCTQCNAHINTPTGAMQSAFEQLRKVTGFMIMEDHLTLRGLCPACQLKEQH